MDVIFEFITIGSYVKVTAVDTETMTEVSISGPASAGETVLKSQALRRLEYVMKRKNKTDKII